MEKSNNIEDQAMHHLLKSFVKQQAKPEVLCEGFDADLASLYLEHVLTQTETSRYEIHLFQCTPCRTSVIALARLMEQEVPLVISKPVEEKPPIHTAVEPKSQILAETKISLADRVKAFFSLLATPRLALPALAALALAISIPFIISQNSNRSITQTAKVSPDGTASPQESPRQAPQAPVLQSGGATSGAPNKEARPEANASGGPENHSSSREVTATGSASVGSGVLQPATETSLAKDNKEEAKNDATVVAENKPRDESPARASEPPAVAAAPPPAPKTEAREKKAFERIDSVGALRVPDNDKNDAKPTTLKPGHTGAEIAVGGNRPTGATIRPEDNKAQPPASSADPGRRKGLADKTTSLRDEREVRKEKARASASRQVSDKTFFLIDDIWTDQKYNKDKELPIVPVIKDSEVYKELLDKHSGLQKFFNAFAANDKVLVVYKGTVYKLLPQDGK